MIITLLPAFASELSALMDTVAVKVCVPGVTLQPQAGRRLGSVFVPGAQPGPARVTVTPGGSALSFVVVSPPGMMEMSAAVSDVTVIGTVAWLSAFTVTRPTPPSMYGVAVVTASLPSYRTLNAGAEAAAWPAPARTATAAAATVRMMLRMGLLSKNAGSALIRSAGELGNSAERINRKGADQCG
jgi:hypothetical protein